MRTKVVNIRKDKCDVYIGRGSIFGNPFIIEKDGNREEVIEKYYQWFYYKLKFAGGFKEEILKLKGKRLGCFCKPRACHGDIIVAYLEQS